jgi:hypothetical protein
MQMLGLIFFLTIEDGSEEQQVDKVIKRVRAPYLLVVVLQCDLGVFPGLRANDLWTGAEDETPVSSASDISPATLQLFPLWGSPAERERRIQRQYRQQLSEPKTGWKRITTPTTIEIRAA